MLMPLACLRASPRLPAFDSLCWLPPPCSWFQNMVTAADATGLPVCISLAVYDPDDGKVRPLGTR